MQNKGLSINGLQTKLPLVQGGMGVGVSMSSLAGAVALGGGVGIISAAQPGYNQEGFDKDTKGTNMQALGEHIRKARAIAPEGVIGVNIMCALTSYNEYVQVCIDNGADLIISGAGLPMNLPELVAGSKVRIAPIVSSVKAAKVLLKLWDKKYGVTCDMLVVEGPKAGGHLAFTADAVEKGIDFDAELALIIAFIKEYEEKYGREIPVVFAGGVFDSTDINHYLQMGCGGVQMATRFVATEECDASQAFKAAYVNAKPEDITLVKSPVGMPGRAISNPFMQKVMAGEKMPVRKCYKCLLECDPATIPYCITEALTNSAAGDTDNGLIFCGETAGRITEMTTVPALLQELFPGYC